jgi:hypothetical protein
MATVGTLQDQELMTESKNLGLQNTVGVGLYSRPDDSKPIIGFRHELRQSARTIQESRSAQSFPSGY